MQKKYELIRLPFDKKIRDLTEKEANIFNRWFIEEMPHRIKVLRDYIQSGDKKTFSQLDFTPDSLIPLGKWFEQKISTRKRTEEEIETEKKSLFKFPDVETQKWVFTEETLSLVFDIGIYLGTIFTKNFKSVKWAYVTKPKSYVYKNWPILEGFKVRMSPVGVVATFAAGLHDKSYVYSRLKDIYDYWEREMKL